MGNAGFISSTGGTFWYPLPIQEALIETFLVSLAYYGNPYTKAYDIPYY